MAEVLIVVGTEGGTARVVAEAAHRTLAAQGHGVDLVLDGDCDSLALAEREALLLCTSTYGLGGPPENLIPFARSLEMRRPDLGALCYGVIAVGDRAFADTFCMAGRTLDEALQALGARRLAERLEIDAGPFRPLPLDAVGEWAREWAERLAVAPAGHQRTKHQGRGTA